MTFIATVIAKNGAAIIADSLVTTQEKILRFENFLKYLKNLPNDENLTINQDELIKQFSNEPVYTKDYENKLFSLGKYIALTTTGIAEINDRRIAVLIEDFLKITQDYLDSDDFNLDVLIDKFVDFLNKEVQGHLKKYAYIGTCSFILTYFNSTNNETLVYKINTLESDSMSLNIGNNYVSYEKQVEFMKVVCGGQTDLSDSILFGNSQFYNLVPDIVEIIKSKLLDLNVLHESLPENFIENLLNDQRLNLIIIKNIPLLKLNSLSLQQAVDLATLLMRLVIDFQKYTNNIPTVGGVIKLAVIDKNGFRYVSGNEIQKPKHLE